MYDDVYDCSSLLCLAVLPPLIMMLCLRELKRLTPGASQLGVIGKFRKIRLIWDANCAFILQTKIEILTINIVNLAAKNDF